MLGTQIQNTNIRSSKLIITKCITQKVLAKSDFGHRFYDLKFLKLNYFIFLEFIINLTTPLQNFVEKHQFNVTLSCFKQILDNYVFNKSSCILLAPSFKISRLFLENELSTYIAWLCKSICFPNVDDFFLHQIQS